jgi:hypothetical protein
MSAKSRTQRIREEILGEWRGTTESYDANSRVTQASRLLVAVLNSVAGLNGLTEEEVQAAWREVAGDFLADNSHPQSVKDGHLLLRVTQPTMRFHLEQLKPVLLERLRAKFGADRIRSVRFTLG